MNKKEFAIFADALKTYFPRENLLPNEQAMELWYRELCDIPYKVAEVALRKWVNNNKWSPSIFEIRELSANITTGNIPDWGEGWKQVLKAIRMFGMYEPTKALDSMDELTREAVKRLGFRELCLSEDIDIDRANFRMIYEQLAKRKQEEMNTSTEIQQTIEFFLAENRVARLNQSNSLITYKEGGNK